ncbi:MULTISPECIES: hypothetical protein [unclassified Spirulina]|uniref:hypothetical protein n=1 Tax=unclassified Spirulina TaxID=2684457 RepID=UPI0019518E66|nr:MULTISPECIES: hypothetical protein [Spirulina]MEA5470802.1 hypothetical protein [Spirulina sp. 06S082]
MVSSIKTFNDVVEGIKHLSTDEKQEIQRLLLQYIREERRNEIYNNVKLAQVEQEKGKLRFSSDLNELKQMLEE